MTYPGRSAGSSRRTAGPTTDIPRILGLYTRSYTLYEVNEGYDDLLNGKNVRGIIVHEH